MNSDIERKTILNPFKLGDSLETFVTMVPTFGKKISHQIDLKIKIFK